MFVLLSCPAATLFRDEMGFVHVRETSDFASVPFEKDEVAARRYYARCVKRAR